MNSTGGFGSGCIQNMDYFRGRPGSDVIYLLYSALNRRKCSILGNNVVFIIADLDGNSPVKTEVDHHTIDMSVVP
jgi:hypothetical protein